MPDPAHLRHARLSRRASAMANLHSMARKSSAYGLHSPTSSKRHSSDPMSSEAHVKEESDLYSDGSDTDYGAETFTVKKEEQSPSPSLLTERHTLNTHHHEDTLAYASLPSSPLMETPTPSSPPPVDLDSKYLQDRSHYVPFSLWDYLREELLATDFDSHQELKWERVSNFLSIPLAVEKVCHP